ncbi:MAG: hypothetical protein OXF88_15495 [Rhodobacteraceae bacterium]|nr:hypothetical protein [Paracoccaceae bacterium]MCY4137979.1 hypothetical protein [Paracoccaceae bacterium]
MRTKSRSGDASALARTDRCGAREASHEALPRPFPPHLLRKFGKEKRYGQLLCTITGHADLANLLWRPVEEQERNYAHARLSENAITSQVGKDALGL